MSDDGSLAALYRPLVDALIAKHALDVEMIDLRLVSGFADAFIIATARSEVNARTLRDAVEEALDEMGLAYKVEGDDSTRWSLVDAGDVIVHIFSREGREFYKLERLWGDAPITHFKSED